MRKAIIFLLLLFPVIGQAKFQITEVMYDVSGSDTGREWLEIYNASSSAVTIGSDFKFNDGANHGLSLSQGTSTIAVGDFAIIADKPDLFLTDYSSYSGNLFDSVVNITNAGTTISIMVGSEIADQLIFSNSWGAAGNGSTLEKIDFTLSNELTNWQESKISGGTPGKFSSVLATSTDPELEPEPDPDPEPDPKPQIDYRDKVILSELLANPVGDDTSGEWLELHNNTNDNIDLIGWSVADSSETKYKFATSIILKANGYLVIDTSVSNIALNNTSDDIRLFDDAGNLIDEFGYTSVKEGWSWAKIDDQWQMSSKPTSGEANIVPENKAPMATISADPLQQLVNKSIAFNAGSSLDPEGEDLTYWWDFGDGQTSVKKAVSHKYSDAGKYAVQLKVSDPQGLSNEQILNMEIINSTTTTPTTASTTTSESSDDVERAQEYQLVEGIMISEFMPNPVGNDNQEWIELYNQNNTDVDISGWILDDAEGGSKPFVFPQGTTIKAGVFQVWSRLATKLALNNTEDSVRLLWPTQEVIDSASYDKSSEGQSYQFDQTDLEWNWSANPSPGQPNVKVAGVETETAIEDNEVNIETNSSVSQAGLVVVPPATWYKQKFYIVDPEFPDQPAIEIYNYQGNFPELKVGDIIKISDYVESEISSGKRLKIQAPEQISVLDNIEVSWPMVITPAEVDEESLNRYITVQGVIEKVNKASLIITADDQRLIIYLGSDWQWQESVPQVGLGVLVKGLVVKSGSDIKLRPISASDFKFETRVVAEEQATTTNTVVDQQTTFLGGISQEENKKYLYIISPAALVGLGWGVYKFVISKMI